MKRIVYISLVLLSLCPVMYQAKAQGKSRDKAVTEYFPTSKVDASVDEFTWDNMPDRQNIRYIYKKNKSNTLIGNPCAIQATHKMGFEYVPKDTFQSGFRIWRNNFGVTLKLFFTKGPFWKSKINKQIRQCAQQSGDRRG